MIATVIIPIIKKINIIRNIAIKLNLTQYLPSGVTPIHIDACPFNFNNCLKSSDSMSFKEMP